MAKAIKEIIIMLLVCLVVMLILAIVLYDYIPQVYKKIRNRGVHAVDDIFEAVKEEISKKANN